MILYGSSMSNGNQHDHDPLPVVIAGGASGKLQGGRHIVAPPHTPMSNLLLSVLDKLGIDQKSFGDSTGKLEIWISNSIENLTGRREALAAATGMALCGPFLDRPKRTGPGPLPLQTTGLEHIGMTVPDQKASAEWYGRIFDPQLFQERDPPPRFYVRMGTAYIASAAHPQRPHSQNRSLFRTGKELQTGRDARRHRKSRNKHGNWPPRHADRRGWHSPPVARSPRRVGENNYSRHLDHHR